MNFVSYTFVGFLLAVWALFMMITPRARIHCLTIASYIFYATWSIPFIAVILVTTTIDYIASIVIDRNRENAGKRKLALTLAIIANLIVLCTFKYLNLLLGTNNNLMAMAGIRNPLPVHLDILLPLGISFYTFEAISYVVDVYRGSRPAPSWMQYNFYIMYFPHLISGPIIRFYELRSQYVDGIQRPSKERIMRGIELIVLGYLFKVVIADNCATIVDPIFANGRAASTLTVYLGTLGFMSQVYFDLMGYTHIARGVSLLFNIELPVNFNHPYNAGSISGYWERWHISLTRWIRDYLFIPLGGSRVGLPRTLINMVIVMGIAGLWHGAGWNVIAWGICHGFLCAGYFIYRKIRPKLLGPFDKIVTENPVYKTACVVVTFWTVLIFLAVFRSPDLLTAATMLNKALRLNSLCTQLVSEMHTDPTTVLVMVLLTLSCVIGPVVVRIYERLFVQMPVEFKLSMATVACAMCWVLGGPAAQPFIYFQF